MKIGTLCLQGFKSALKRGLENLVVNEKIDILSLQDIKVKKENFYTILEEYEMYYNSKSLGIIARKSLNIKNYEYHHDEIMSIELSNFNLINIYLRPSNMGEIFKKLLSVLKKLEKPVIITGDFNTAIPSNRNLSFLEYKHLNKFIEKLLLEYEIYDVFMFISKLDGNKKDYPRDWNYIYTYAHNNPKNYYYLNDHILFSKSIAHYLTKFYVKNVNISDHFPLIAEFKDLS